MKQNTRRSHGILGALAISAALPLAACNHVPDAVNPVAWYRDVSGISRNDDQDQNQRNQANLEQGGKEPYPNLADVPDVPDRATSGIDRKKLTESLVADRENAKYSNEQLQAGRQLGAAAPPPPPNVGGNASSASSSATTTTASSVTQTPVSPPPAPPPASTPTPAPAPTNTAARQSAPMESSLQQPAARTAPQGEAPAAIPNTPAVTRSAPPPPPPPPVASTAPSAPPPHPAVISSAPPASTAPPQPAGVRSGGQPSLAMRTPSGAANAISVSVGDITFAPGSASLSAAHRGALSEIAGLYKQAGGKIRIVGHAETSTGGDAVAQRMTAFNLSVDRANAVAQALSTMGVPAEDMTIQSAPQRGGQELPRAEVFMEY